MTKEQVIEKVNDFLIEEFEIEEDQLVGDALLKDDLEIESLDFVDIVVIIEKEFGLKIKGSEMKEVLTLDQFYSYIHNQLN
ncbi:MAG: phosphopantetheine-binding protein [Bacteroidales bacterium]|jgi:acyl carrier protein|nr:phosphopantetheine-binding protein [Bacteroidales bacterium]